MSFTEWLLWIACAWAVFMTYCASDLPDLLARAANRLRQQHLPHWARHGHAPPETPVAPAHGRHARHTTTRGGSA